MKTTAKRRIPMASAFQFVKAASVSDDIFAKPDGRKSVYRDALQHLFDHPDERMEVASVTARGAIAAQAKKGGFKVLFGERDQKLYVKVIGKDSEADRVLLLLADEPANVLELEASLAKQKTKVDNLPELLQKLSESGHVALRTVPGTNVKKWHLVHG